MVTTFLIWQARLAALAREQEASARSLRDERARLIAQVARLE